MTLEEQLEEQAKKGLLGLGLKEETASTYAPWASLLAQFVPGVGEGVGIDNTREAIEDERYGDAAIEGGLTLLGVIPGLGDVAAAAIKGMRKAPVKAFDEAAWLKESPPPFPDIKPKDMSPSQLQEHKRHIQRKFNAKNGARRAQQQRDKYHQDQAYRDSERNRSKEYRKDRYQNDDEWRNQENLKSRERDALRRADPEYLEAKNAKERARYSSDESVRQAATLRRAQRRAAQLQRTPVWADPDRIDEIYRSAADASLETGIPHHVDHVIPLQGKNVSGLHHQDNLLIVPGPENLSKGNKFEPGKPPPRAGVRKARKLLKEIRNGKKQ